MRILSFDTSTNALHLSLLMDGAPVLEREVQPAGAERQEVASLLMFEIDSAFRQVQWPKRSLDLIVVGVGPGSFTGIRVAVITARTLAQVLSVPLMGISILESSFAAVSASATIGDNGPVGIILGTTAGQYFYSAFRRTAADPAEPVIDPGFGNADMVAERLAGSCSCYADVAAISNTAANAKDLPAQPLPFIKNLASIQAHLAGDRLSCMRLGLVQDAGNKSLSETFPWERVLPLYVRSPSVTVKNNHATANPPLE
jgi:tRNA threonylcarbamoyl adenosine modification protein YeaZ